MHDSEKTEQFLGQFFEGLQTRYNEVHKYEQHLISLANTLDLDVDYVKDRISKMRG